MPRHDNINCAPTLADEKLPFISFNFSDGLIDSLFPSTPVCVLSSNIPNPLVRTHSVGFIDAADAYAAGHLWPFQNAGPLLTVSESGLIVRLLVSPMPASSP
jgi:hypothetical protein